MPIVTLNQIHIAFGPQVIFDRLKEKEQYLELLYKAYELKTSSS